MKTWWINVKIGYHLAWEQGASPLVATICALYCATFGLPQ